MQISRVFPTALTNKATKKNVALETLGRATEVYFPLCYRAKWTGEGGYLRGLLLCVTLSSFFHQDRRFPSRILEEFFFFFFRIKISYFAWKICDEIVPREVGGNRWRVSRVNVRGMGTIMKFLFVRWSKFVRHVLKRKAIHVQEFLTTFGD